MRQQETKSNHQSLDDAGLYESDAYYIRCLDFGIMSWGNTIEECK